MMRLLMLFPALHLLPLYQLTLKKSKPKIWMHINHCLSSAQAIPIQEVQNLLCVDAADSDAENLCMWFLANLLDTFIFRNFVHKSLEQFCKTKTVY